MEQKRGLNFSFSVEWKRTLTNNPKTKDCNWQTSKCPTLGQHSTAVPPRRTVWTLFCTTQPLGGASWLPFHPKSPHALSLCSLLSLLRMTLQFMMMHHYAEFCFKCFSSSEVIIHTNFTEMFNLYLDFKHINPILSLDTLARMMYRQARSTSKRISS